MYYYKKNKKKNLNDFEGICFLTSEKIHKHKG